MQARWQAARLTCEEKRHEYAAMTLHYEQWRKSVDGVGLRLADVEARFNQSRGDPDTTAVRMCISR